MLRLWQSVSIDPFDYVPFTVLVTLQGSDFTKWPGWQTFVSAFQHYSRMDGCKNLWLLKPTRCVRGGRGWE